MLTTRHQWSLDDLQTLIAAMTICDRLACAGAVPPEITGDAVLALGKVLGVAGAAKAVEQDTEEAAALAEAR